VQQILIYGLFNQIVIIFVEKYGGAGVIF